jgi:hypothetical protein
VISLHANVCGVIHTVVDLSITTALNHIATQLFVAGLRPAIWVEMIKGLPVLLWDTFQQDITLAKIHMPFKVNLPMVNKIDENQDTIQLDGKIEAVQAQLN